MAASVASSTHLPSSTSNSDQTPPLPPSSTTTQFPLITTLSLSLSQHTPPTLSLSHPSIYWAHHMALIHNTQIRALSRSYTFASTISPSTQQAKDFLFFNATIAHTLHKHHDLEDTFIFPSLEALMPTPNALHANSAEHDSFRPALAAYTHYSTTTSPADYSGTTLLTLLDNLVPALIQHFHTEIPSLLSTHVITNTAALQKVWEDASALAAKGNDIAVLGPFLMGNQDGEFAIDGRECDFPGFPEHVEQMVREGEVGRRYKGAWEFCWSDSWGRRRGKEQ